MAQTKKRRRRKHRGTQGGSIDRRPKRRPQNRAEARQRAKSRSGSGSRGQRPSRADNPPTWRGAWARAALASAVFFALMMVGFGRTPTQSAGIALFMLAVYAPMGYYFDLFLYRRRQRKKAAERSKASES